MKHSICSPTVLGAVLILHGCENPAPVSPESTYGKLLGDLETASASETKLTASDRAPDDLFGVGVAIHGHLAIVGASGDDDGGVDAGSAYVFRRSEAGWTQEAKLTASDRAAGDEFGIAVSIHGELAIVGAQSDDDGGVDAGSAYVFRRTETGWTQEAKLTASDGAAGDFFGVAVDIHDGLAIIGADEDDDGGFNAGSAYVFRRTETGWTQEAKLAASDRAASDRFGFVVGIHRGLAIVGAFGDDNDAGVNAGSAYVFQRTGTGWTQQAKLTAGDGAAGDQFGFAVAIHEQLAIVGAFGDDNDAGVNAGSAYVFRRTGTGWTEQAKLTASDGAAGDRFGFTAAIHGGRAIVGALGDDGLKGSAYVFRRTATGWAQEAKLMASDAAAGDRFGFLVSIQGGRAIVGAIGDDAFTGSAYVFDIGMDDDEGDG